MIKYLLKIKAVFICEMCGDTTEILVPGEGDNIEQSYCCKARYRITNTEGGIFIERILDTEEQEGRAIPLD